MIYNPVEEAAHLVDECKPLAFSGLSIEPIYEIELEYAKKIALQQVAFAKKFAHDERPVTLVKGERGIVKNDGNVLTSQMRYLERLEQEILKIVK